MQVRNRSRSTSTPSRHSAQVVRSPSERPQNDANLVGLAPNLNLSGMAANSTIARDIIFNNGGLTVAGAAVKSSFNPSYDGAQQLHRQRQPDDQREHHGR